MRTNEQLIRDIKSVRKLLRKPIISFRKDWNQHFEQLVAEARRRGLGIKGITWQ